MVEQAEFACEKGLRYLAAAHRMEIHRLEITAIGGDTAMRLTGRIDGADLEVEPECATPRPKAGGNA